MDEKERDVERRVEQPPAERDDVRVAGTRCPYCHEDVARETADVCRDCLARHHGGCWAEGQRCGACGSVHVLRPVLPPLTPARLRELFGAVLRREGYPEAEIERVIPPAPDRCATPGCHARGVALTAPMGPLSCATHAAAARQSNRLAGVLFLFSAVASLLTFVTIAVASKDPGFLIVGGALFLTFGLISALILVPARRLPPIPETLPGKGA